MRYSIADIARVITEDPNLLSELDSSIDPSTDEPAGSVATAPITPGSKIDKSVAEPEVDQEKPMAQLTDEWEEESAGEDPDQQMKDQTQAQEEAERQQEAERRKILEPQMQNLQTSMDTLGTDITRGVAAANQGDEAFSGLDKNMATIQTILKNLESQLY